jgi:hypothetical protein
VCLKLKHGGGEKITTYIHPVPTEIQWNTSADDVNLLGDNIDTLNDASKEVGLEVNSEETKYMSLSLHQNSGQNPVIKVANKSFENVTQFKCLGMAVKDKNLTQEET